VRSSLTAYLALKLLQHDRTGLPVRNLAVSQRTLVCSPSAGANFGIQRGKLACIEFTGNIVGYASSVWIDYFSSFIPSNLSWRFPLSLQCVIGCILAIGSLAIPESPRWLLDTDQDEDGMRVLADLHGEGDPDSEDARNEFKEIKEGIITDVSSSTVCPRI
jgi:hypothetical protein